MEDYKNVLKKIPRTLYKVTEESHLAKLISMMNHNFNEIQTVAEELRSLRSIETQTGEVLDKIGEIVGEPRKNRGDEVYRLFLYVAIQRNISNGSLNMMSDILQIIVGEDKKFNIDELSKYKGERLLDGKKKNGANGRKLNGTYLLNGEWSLPATLDIEIPKISLEGVENGEALLKDVIEQIKPAGVNALVEFIETPSS